MSPESQLDSLRPLKPDSKSPQHSGRGSVHSQAPRLGPTPPPHPGLARPGPTPPPISSEPVPNPSPTRFPLSDRGIPTVTILVCPAGAVRVEGGSGGRALLGGRSMLTPGSCPGDLWCGRCRGLGEGSDSLEGRGRARARVRARG